MSQEIRKTNKDRGCPKRSLIMNLLGQPFHFFKKGLFLNFVAVSKERQRKYTDILIRNNFLRKDAPIQADFEELAYEENNNLYENRLQ
jgi:hypothetical protein